MFGSDGKRDFTERSLWLVEKRDSQHVEIEQGMTMIQILVSPIDSIQIDLIQCVYDVLIAVITGYLVWFKTDEFMQRRDERSRYQIEQQGYSRYISRVVSVVESLRGPNDYQRTYLLELLGDSPVRTTFRPITDEQRVVFKNVEGTLSALYDLLATEPHELDIVGLKRCAGELRRYRIALVSFRLDQPKTHWYHIAGKPAVRFKDDL